jgi:hypothetical protein
MDEVEYTDNEVADGDLEIKAVDRVNHVDISITRLYA